MIVAILFSLLLSKKNRPWFLQQRRQKRACILSNPDQISVIFRTICCFKSNVKGNAGAVEFVDNAMSKVLVRYHPLAGRLMTSSEGKLIVDCSGECALFIEAEANCKINDIRDTAKSDPATLGKLVYEIPGVQICFRYLLWWLRIEDSLTTYISWLTILQAVYSCTAVGKLNPFQ